MLNVDLRYGCDMINIDKHCIKFDGDCMDYKNKTFGLVFEGGGARGAYEIGVWKAIKELDIKVSAVVGTSIGAMNGALFAQGDLDLALEIWENIKYSSVIDVEDDLVQKLADFKWREVSIQESGQRFLDIIKNRGLDITPLKQMIAEFLVEEELRKSDIRFGLVTFNLTDFKPMELMIEDIPEGQLAGYLLASAYLPSFKSEKIFGKRFLDGGFHSVVPTDMLVDQGYTDIIEVRIQGLGFEQRVDEANLNIVRIEAKENLGGLLELRAERAKRSINLGYFDALKTFKGLSGNEYYIEEDLAEASYLKEFLKLPRARLEHMIISLGGKSGIIKFRSKERLVCEVLIPMLIRKMKMDHYVTYEEIYYELLEHKARILEVDKFKIYANEDFKATIKGAFESLDKDSAIELLRNDDLVELATWMGV